MDRDPKLLEFATDRQAECLEAYWAEGTYRAAAAKLGIGEIAVAGAVQRISEKAAQRGYAPAYGITHELPPGLVLKGTSIRYNKDGEAEQYWNKSRVEGADPEQRTHVPDPKTIVKVSTLFDQQGRVTQQWVAEKPEEKAKEAAWQAFAAALKEELPRAEPVPAPEHTMDDILVTYPLGDHHWGMYAWQKDAGGDYDLDIAEKLLYRAFDYLIQAAPPATTALIAVLGDYLHYDGMIPITPTSGNHLDADSRFPKMIRAALKGLRYAIARALEKHREVNIIIEIGNHDLATSVFMMECLRVLYENDPRVNINTSPQHFHYFEFGKVLIGTHHGHGVKAQDLPIIMAADMPQAWGRTVHRYIWTGHWHTLKVTEIGGVTVETFRVLGPTDAWAQQKGYRSKRSMTSIVFHKEDGEVARNTVSPAMLMR